MKTGKMRDFPGGPMVKTSPSKAAVASLIPDQGDKITHASWRKAKPKQNKKKQKQHCDKFNKDFFLMVHTRGKKRKHFKKRTIKMRT